MAILVSQFNDLSKNAEVQWQSAQLEHPEVRSQIATIVSVMDRSSEHSGMSELPTARRRDDGDDAYKGEMSQAYTKKFTQQEIALEVDVTKQMRKFDKYDEIMSKVRNSRRSATRRIELDVASLLSYAWSTSYTNLDGETVTTSTPDGLTLIDAAHTPNGTSDTWSNELSGNHSAISQTTLENLLDLFNNFLDDGDGRSIVTMADSIITGDHIPTKHEVKRILGSIQEPGSANNDTNVNKNSLSHVVVPFLDFNAQTETRDSNKKKYTFVANLQNSDRNGFRVEESQGIRLEAPEQVFESGTWQFMTTGLYDFGSMRANFISGTKGDGSAV